MIFDFRVTLVVDPGPASFTSNHQCWIQVSLFIPKKVKITISLRVMRDYKLPMNALVGTEQTGCSLLPGSSTK